MGMISDQGGSSWQINASDETFDGTYLTVEIDIDVSLNIEISPLTLNIVLEIESEEDSTDQ